MIRANCVLHIVGLFLLVLGGAMCGPLAYGLATGSHGGVRELALGAGLTWALGALFWRGFPRPEKELNVREGALLVTLVWVAAGSAGSLPYVFSGHFGTLTDAVFETVSGFTTTGATILPDVEVLPPPLQLWRHLSHWLGGMGIVLLGLAILPLLSTGGLALYRAEFSGAKSEKLKPRIAETAMALWRIYLALTVAEYMLLRFAGMDAFDAICHSFSTMATGGFSTRTASVAAFGNPLIEWIIIVFMILAGTNFALHYRLFVERNPGRFFFDPELRTYVGVILCSTALVLPTVAGTFHAPGGLEEAVRVTMFQICSIATSTGFATYDYEKWVPMAQFLLLAHMFMGACTGSTSGGLKVGRVLLLAKVVGREFKKMVERRGVFAIRLGGEVVPEHSIQALLNLVYLMFLFNTFACLAVAMSGVDVLTSISAVAACMSSIGPGLGEVGPADNYSGLPAAAKWVLSVTMIAGRLEFYTLLVLFVPAFWRK